MPSAPFVLGSKHLQCFVSIDLSKTRWDYDKCRYPIHHLNSCNFQQTQIYARRKQGKPSTISLCEAPIEICLLQIEPLSTTKFLPRCCWDLRTPGKIQLFQQRRVAQGLKQICGSICSLGVFVEAPAVFWSETICRKHLGTTTSWCRYPIHLKPIQINSNSYDIIRQLHKPIQILTRATSNRHK